jgi:chromosome segregation ATPase
VLETKLQVEYARLRKEKNEIEAKYTQCKNALELKANKLGRELNIARTALTTAKTEEITLMKKLTAIKARVTGFENNLRKVKEKLATSKAEASTVKGLLTEAMTRSKLNATAAERNVAHRETLLKRKESALDARIAEQRALHQDYRSASHGGKVK